MIFTYWHGPLPDALPNIADWRTVCRDVRIFTDRDVLPIAAQYGAELVDLYRRIRLPAARADVARLLLLEAHGGMYVDFHVGTANPIALAHLISQLCVYEMVVIDQPALHSFDGDLALPSSVLLARKGAKPACDIIWAVSRNLARQFENERNSTEHVPYNTVVVTGPWAISVVLFDRSRLPILLRQQYHDTVLAYAIPRDPARAPFLNHRHYGYRKPGLHWSERQKHERLFLTDAEMTATILTS